MFDFQLFKTKPEFARKSNGALAKGFAAITFPDVKGADNRTDIEYYDLRGSAFSERQFQNWAKVEFGYLRYEVRFG